MDDMLGSPESAHSSAAPSGTSLVRQEDILGKYVVSIRGGGRIRVLHRVGNCHRIPGHTYREFEMFGDVFPSSQAFTAQCKDCWPVEERQNTLPSSPSTSSHGSSSSRSSDRPPSSA